MMPPFALGPYITNADVNQLSQVPVIHYNMTDFLKGVFQAGPVLLNIDIYQRSEWHHPQQPQSVWLYSRMCHAENDVTSTDDEYRKLVP